MGYDVCLYLNSPGIISALNVFNDMSSALSALLDVVVDCIFSNWEDFCFLLDELEPLEFVLLALSPLLLRLLFMEREEVAIGLLYISTSVTGEGDKGDGETSTKLIRDEEEEEEDEEEEEEEEDEEEDEEDDETVVVNTLVLATKS